MTNAWLIFILLLNLVWLLVRSPGLAWVACNLETIQPTKHTGQHATDKRIQVLLMILCMPAFQPVRIELFFPKLRATTFS